MLKREPLTACHFNMLGSWDSPISLFMVTILLSLKESETMPKLAIFKLLELPWDSPTFPVHGHYNAEPYTIWNHAEIDDF